VAFALLIPEKKRTTLHMQYLQNIATALLDKKFNEIILNSSDKTVIFDTILKAINNKNDMSNKETLNHDLPLIVGVSSCATGVAHTYMAREALEKHGKDVGYEV
jgi:hypothetical protein